MSACVICGGGKAALPGDDLCAECRKVLEAAGVVRVIRPRPPRRAA